MSDAAAPTDSMQLVAQDYAEVLAALKAMNDTKGHERRTFARMDVQAQVKCYPITNGRMGTPFTCMTRDLSFRGIGLLQAQPSPKGTQFVIVLPKQLGKPLPVLCVVQYSRPLADGLYNIGAAFVRTFDFNKAPINDAPAPAAKPAKPATQPAQSATPADPEAELKRIRQSILD